MRSYVIFILIIIAFLFIAGQSPATRASVGSNNLLDLFKEYIALIAALLAILSTIIGFIYQQRNFRQELKEFEKKYISEDEQFLSWVEKVTQQIDTPPIRALFRSPYILGTPIFHRQNVYGRQKEAEDILTSAVGGPQLQSISILGAPLSGKTSLLNYIKHPHTLEEYNIKDVVPVYLNLQAGILEPTDFYTYLLNESAKAIQQYGIATAPIPHLSMYVEYQVVKEFFQKACQRKFRFLLIIDKFETFIRENFNRKFFDELRSLSTNQEIAWIITSYRDLTQLFTEKFKPKPGEIFTSPFANVILKSITLDPLSKKEAQELIKKPAIKSDHSFSQDDVKFILNLDRLMPFELQVASSALYEAQINNSDNSEACRLNAKIEYEKIMERFYERYWNNLKPDEQLILKYIVNNDVIDETQPVTDLFNYGYIKKEEDSYRIAGAVFQEWIRMNHCA